MLPSRRGETMRALSFPLRPLNESFTGSTGRDAAITTESVDKAEAALAGASAATATPIRAARKLSEEKGTCVISRRPVDAEVPADRRPEQGEVTQGSERLEEGGRSPGGWYSRVHGERSVKVTSGGTPPR